ncbi:S8 family peptidase [Fulvivirga ligni]|uniref:S8 family peptidase n=1 Tax=Fulvivirga ligni TaxID=2904246 RepID=UPI001F41BC9D|nr:S8 family peptidase [Fulvivirga ligni]UII19376.1 S8 family peptidase [Fulvivirga ligni]
MVYFTDKENSPYSTNSPEAFLSQKSINRRLDQSITIDESDLPVNPAYVQGVQDLGVATYYRSKWLNGVFIETQPSSLESILALDYVESIVLLAPGTKLGRIGSAASENEQQKEQAETDLQLEMMGLNKLHDEGYRGEGMYVAVFDGGFSGYSQISGMENVSVDQLKYSYNFVSNSSSVNAGSDHGTKVLSIMAGEIAGEYTGSAHNADYMLCITEDISGEYTIEEYNWLVAAERADSAGVDIINSSLGYFDFDDPSMNYTPEDFDGETTIIAKAANFATAKGMLVVVSVGNEGNSYWGYITSPADALNVISVGSITTDYSLSAFSSSGPTEDGRIKPELVALGSGTTFLSSSGITSGSGTSFATPLVAGFASCLWQKYRDLSAAEIRAMMLANASQSSDPENGFGYGIPNYNNIISGNEKVVDQQAFLVYPNPLLGDEITIRTAEFKGDAQVSIYNLNGVLSFEKHAYFNGYDDFKLKVNLSKGIYLMKIVMANQTYHSKLIKY